MMKLSKDDPCAAPQIRMLGNGEDSSLFFADATISAICVNWSSARAALSTEERRFCFW